MKVKQSHGVSDPVTGASLVVDVVVTHFFVQKPLGPSADSDYDCYGYTELEYDVVRVFNEDDEVELPIDTIPEGFLDEKVEEKMSHPD